MENTCSICPRNCGACGGKGRGYCLSPALPKVARAAAHFGEEPCIGGSRGTGAVFFTGCNLRCVFCQNREISRGRRDAPHRARAEGTVPETAGHGSISLDLVTGTHYTPWIAEALSGLELGIPVVWNSSGYESVESLRQLEGLVQVYMPDFKYWKGDIARRYSAAEDYPAVAKAAIKEMYRQVGPYELDGEGLMKRGVLIRHLILPGQDLNAMDVMDFAAEEFPAGSVMFSLMSQYTPMPGLDKFPELQSPIEPELNERLISYMRRLGLEGYWQETGSATEEMIPDFDLTGL